eukprot:4879832-Amphidinium_carterae.1
MALLNTAVAKVVHGVTTSSSSTCDGVASMKSLQLNLVWWCGGMALVVKEYQERLDLLVDIQEEVRRVDG